MGLLSACFLPAACSRPPVEPIARPATRPTTSPVTLPPGQREIFIDLDPDRAKALGVQLKDVTSAIETFTKSVTSTTKADLEAIELPNTVGLRVFLRDVARVNFGTVDGVQTRPSTRPAVRP